MRHGKASFTIKPRIEDGTIYLREETTISAAGDPNREAFKLVNDLMLDTKEKIVRDALIKLGWTPPAYTGEERRAPKQWGRRYSLPSDADYDGEERRSGRDRRRDHHWAHRMPT